MTRLRRVALSVNAVIALGASSMTARGQALTTVRVASGLTRPVYVTAPPGDTTRLFIVQHNGVVRVVRLTTDPPTLLELPFLDIRTLVAYSGESGFLGTAFDPDYSRNGFFYVSYNAAGGANTLARYSVSNDPDIAASASARILKSIPRPVGNHNGGCIQFGPDGFLYMSTGEAGLANLGQSTGTLLGKLLRLDVHHPPDYIPATNPFVGPGNPLDEIWALGLRNPWRFSFDRGTGDLYIGDVGAGSREEVDYTPAPSAGGENYGWSCYEGELGSPPSTCLTTGVYRPPVHTYSHSFGCAVAGGYVYRGPEACWLQGAYVFGDYCSARIWSFRVVGGLKTDFIERTSHLAPGGGQTINAISAFGEDAAGNLYICDLGGEVFKIVASPTPAAIASAAPPADGIDPREDLTAGAAAGLREFQLTFASSNIGLCASEISVNCNGGAPCPTVSAVAGSGAGPYTITLSAPIPPGYCTRFSFAHAAPGAANPLTYRFLPGDVNQNSVTTGADVVTLVAAINSGVTTPALHDINRNGVVTGQDVLRLVQLLNGTDATQAWNGVSLVCP